MSTALDRIVYALHSDSSHLYIGKSTIGLKRPREHSRRGARHGAS